MTRLLVITGASSGIGAEFARQLAATHDTHWLIGRRQQQLDALAKSLHAQYGVEARVMVRDLSEQAAIEHLAEELQQQPGLCTLINNAGYAEDGDFHQLDWSLHRALMNVHVEATLKLSYAALQVMVAKAEGTIINVSSVAAFLPTPASPLYGPSKAFGRSLAETLAAKYRQHNIRIQALCPGFTVTDFHEKLGLDRDDFYRKRGLLRAYSAEFVVAQSLRDLQGGRVVSVPGWNYRLIVMLLRMLPSAWMSRLVNAGAKAHRYSAQ